MFFCVPPLFIYTTRVRRRFKYTVKKLGASSKFLLKMPWKKNANNDCIYHIFCIKRTKKRNNRRVSCSDSRFLTFLRFLFLCPVFARESRFLYSEIRLEAAVHGYHSAGYEAGHCVVSEIEKRADKVLRNTETIHRRMRYNLF